MRPTTPLSELATELADATGYTRVYVYRLLRSKAEPSDRSKVPVWRRLVARAARRLTRTDGARAKLAEGVDRVVAASCPQSRQQAARCPGQVQP